MEIENEIVSLRKELEEIEKRIVCIYSQISERLKGIDFSIFEKFEYFVVLWNKHLPPVFTSFTGDKCVCHSVLIPTFYFKKDAIVFPEDCEKLREEVEEVKRVIDYIYGGKISEIFSLVKKYESRKKIYRTLIHKELIRRFDSMSVVLLEKMGAKLYKGELKVNTDFQPEFEWKPYVCTKGVAAPLSDFITRDGKILRKKIREKLGVDPKIIEEFHKFAQEVSSELTRDLDVSIFCYV